MLQNTKQNENIGEVLEDEDLPCFEKWDEISQEIFIDLFVSIVKNQKKTVELNQEG